MCFEHRCYAALLLSHSCLQDESHTCSDLSGPRACLQVLVSPSCQQLDSLD